MDRHGDPRAQQLQRPGGACGIEVARRQAGAPPADRQQRHVEVAGEVSHPVEEIRVPGEVDAGRAVDHVAERAGAVLGVRGGDTNWTNLHLVAGLDLDDVGEAAPAYALRRGCRDDHTRRSVEERQGPAVQMVVVAVRDEQRIDAFHVRGRRCDAPQMQQPRPEHRIREQACAVQFDQDGAVADPGDPRQTSIEAHARGRRRHPDRMKRYSSALRPNATANPIVVTTPTSGPACSNASGIIVSASIVRIAPPAKARTTATTVGEALSKIVNPITDATPETAATSVQRPRMRLAAQPERANPLVAAIASGMFESATATKNAALMLPETTIVSPRTSDSGIPSSTMPSTIASADPSACLPDERFRSAPPIRSISTSPTKKTAEPAKRPNATAPLPCRVANASATSSYATELIRTPPPNAMMTPSARSPI